MEDWSRKVIFICNILISARIKKENKNSISVEKFLARDKIYLHLQVGVKRYTRTSKSKLSFIKF